MGDIFIEKPFFEENRLISHYSTSSDLEQYLKDNELFIVYDAKIYADESVLSTPLTATLLPLAWLTGSDIHVDILDRRFKESMEQLQKEFAEMYPKAPFTTQI